MLWSVWQHVPESSHSIAVESQIRKLSTAPGFDTLATRCHGEKKSPPLLLLRWFMPITNRRALSQLCFIIGPASHTLSHLQNTTGIIIIVSTKARCRACAGLRLVHCRRQWPNFKLTKAQRLQIMC